MEKWFEISLVQVGGIALTTLLIYVLLTLIVRLYGLRTFSKISSHDFPITVAIGSILATTVLSDEPSLTQAVLAIFLLLLWKTIFSFLRIKGFNGGDNEPLLIGFNGELLIENIHKANLTEHDVYAKIRESNCLNLEQMRAIIFESTGDVSVLHGEKDKFDEKVLQGVRR